MLLSTKHFDDSYTVRRKVSKDKKKEMIAYLKNRKVAYVE